MLCGARCSHFLFRKPSVAFSRTGSKRDCSCTRDPCSAMHRAWAQGSPYDLCSILRRWLSDQIWEPNLDGFWVSNLPQSENSPLHLQRKREQDCLKSKVGFPAGKWHCLRHCTPHKRSFEQHHGPYSRRKSPAFSCSVCKSQISLKYHS
jgi:hypothetical protein